MKNIKEAQQHLRVLGGIIVDNEKRMYSSTENGLDINENEATEAREHIREYALRNANILRSEIDGFRRASEVEDRLEELPMNEEWGGQCVPASFSALFGEDSVPASLGKTLKKQDAFERFAIERTAKSGFKVEIPTTSSRFIELLEAEGTVGALIETEKILVPFTERIEITKPPFTSKEFIDVDRTTHERHVAAIIPFPKLEKNEENGMYLENRFIVVNTANPEINVGQTDRDGVAIMYGLARGDEFGEKEVIVFQEPKIEIY